MSTTYYLRNRQKYKEYEAFRGFWENLVSKTKLSLTEYCEKTNGELVDRALAKDIVDDTISRIKRCPIDQEQFDMELFICSESFVHMRYEVCTKSGACIQDVASFEAFMKTEEAKRYQIVNEYWEEVSYEEMLRILNARKMRG